MGPGGGGGQEFTVVISAGRVGGGGVTRVFSARPLLSLLSSPTPTHPRALKFSLSLSFFLASSRPPAESLLALSRDSQRSSRGGGGSPIRSAAAAPAAAGGGALRALPPSLLTPRLRGPWAPPRHHALP